MTPRRTLAGLCLAVSATLLAGCATELPQPRPEQPPQTPPPALDEDRLQRVLSEVEGTIAQGDEENDGQRLGPRIMGPAADTRRAEYALARATDGNTSPAPLITDANVTSVAASDSWPRPAMVITDVPEGENLPLLLGLVQPNPRDPYALWGWVTLFPGIQLPGMDRIETGSPVLEPDAEGLAATPEQVVDRYVNVFNNGDDSDFADAFAEDPYRTSSHETTDELSEAIEAAGEASVEAEVGDDGPLALATAEGGAIVISELRSTLTMTRTVPESELTAGGELAALMEDDEVVGSVSGVSDVTIAFYVPPADAEDTTIQPIGATSVLADVNRDDDAAPE
ncbi:hypothetical protein [Georgenia alba]|uniref:DUF8094 domain-containing protein n=1 Tax=Georgenia alba TaxID=2233858 RepID=A0ABW2Q9V4_9MICO